MNLSSLRSRGEALYERYGRYLPPVFFVGGVTWDSLTLRRIDQWLDNLLLLVYLALLGVLIAVVVLYEAEKLQHRWLDRFERFLPLVIQFFLGGLFSAYVVFYFKSAALLRSWVFLLILVGLLVANEFLEHRLRSVTLLLPLYFLACFSYFTFFIPVAVRVVNHGTFIAAGLVSLGIVAAMLLLFRRKGVFEGVKPVALLAGAVFTLYAAVNVFYVMNWIPPVPLAMKAGGVYHRALFDRANDRYVLLYEDPGVLRFWTKESDPFRYAEGDTVNCFVAVFAPTGLKKDIYHEWQRYDEATKTWQTLDRIPYRDPIVGKRDEGYRGVTRKRRIDAPGRWRVDIKTPDGLTIGRVPFSVEIVDDPVRTFHILYR